MVLAIAVAGLGTWVYLRPQPQTAESHVLSDLKSEDVKRMRIESAGAAAPIELERAEQGWRMTAPFAARADKFQVERLVALPAIRASARFAAPDLARYGLDQPSARVSLNGRTFAFGAVNTATREQYVLVDDAVYTIPLSQRTAVPREAHALISRELFAPDEVPVRFDLEGFTAALHEGVWAFVPAAEDAGVDARNAWADAWRRATAARAARHDGAPADSAITVHLKDGRTITLGLLKREAEVVLVRADEGVQYYFFADAAKRLLSPPAAPRDEKK